MSMIKSKRGFTLIEVAIFLAITGALFVSVAVGVQNSVYQQRINDSVQNFMEFLRAAYAEVSDVQNAAGGRSEKVIYGKLITFGEKYNLAGDRISEGELPGNEAFVYTVIGDSGDANGEGTLASMKTLNANVVRKVPTRDGGSTVELAGIAESYAPKWAAQLEPPCGADAKLSSCKFEPITGMMLILRHPNSGTISTYWSNDLIEVNEQLQRAKNYGNVDVNIFNIDGADSLSGFKSDQIDFCINNTGESNVTNRADVRVIKGAKNASGIELIANDVSGYVCGK